MSEIAIPDGYELELPAHGPGRALGQKRKAHLKLGMGYRDEAKRGAPVKTDYFIPRGDDRAVAKFMAKYGDKPRAIDIRLPGSLGSFLRIEHVAFAKSKSGQAYLRAHGCRNFADEGTLGGHDTLTIYEYGDKDMKVTENVPVTGKDDPTCVELGVQLMMTVTFGIPDVLGFGGLCQVTSRGKESIDTLWENAVDIYGTLGSLASVALRPKLLLKASTMLTPGGQKTPLYVLDLYSPESLDEVYARLEQHHALVPARGRAAMALMYGAEDRVAGELPPAPADEPAEPRTYSAPTLDPGPDVPARVPDGTTLTIDGATVSFSGMTLSEVAAHEHGEMLFLAVLEQEPPGEFRTAVETYVEHARAAA